MANRVDDDVVPHHHRWGIEVAAGYHDATERTGKHAEQRYQADRTKRNILLQSRPILLSASVTHPSRIGALSQRPQIDPQRLALLVEMAALQPQRLGGIAHALVVALEFRENLLALERIQAL